MAAFMKILMPALMGTLAASQGFGLQSWQFWAFLTTMIVYGMATKENPK